MVSEGRRRRVVRLVNHAPGTPPGGRHRRTAMERLLAEYRPRGPLAQPTCPAAGAMAPAASGGHTPEPVPSPNADPDAPVRLERAGDVAVISLCRPPSNAADPGLIAALGTAVDRIAADDSRAVLLRSDVPGFFMAGADITTMLAALEAGDRAEIARMQELPALLDRIEALPKPTVAAIAGVAAGGGLELALACDLRICGRAVRVGLPEIRLGLIPGAGGTQRLTRLVGPGRALDLMLDGRLVLGEEAERLGIVTRAVADEDVDAEARGAAERLAAASPVALAAIKRAVAAAQDGNRAAGMRAEREGIEAALWSPEALAGLRAFLERRR
jgi:enoyl-CoA hydratase